MEFARETRDIDGRAFEIRALPAKLGRKALMRLAKKVGPALAAMVDGKDLASVADLGKLDVDLGAVARQLAEDLDEADLDWFCDLFAGHTQVEVTPGTGQLLPLDRHFDHVFSSNYQAMLKWLWACLEVNFGGFFAGAGASGPAPAPAEKGSPRR